LPWLAIEVQGRPILEFDISLSIVPSGQDLMACATAFEQVLHSLTIFAPNTEVNEALFGDLEIQFLLENYPLATVLRGHHGDVYHLKGDSYRLKDKRGLGLDSSAA
jgi:hypothetical protein